jgi:hypothetical protein
MVLAAKKLNICKNDVQWISHQSNFLSAFLQKYENLNIRGMKNDFF